MAWGAAGKPADERRYTHLRSCGHQCTLCGPPVAGTFTKREAEEQLVLRFDSALPQPTAEIWITFSYQLRAGLSGFYRWEEEGRGRGTGQDHIVCWPAH